MLSDLRKLVRLIASTFQLEMWEPRKEDQGPIVESVFVVVRCLAGVCDVADLKRFVRGSFVLFAMFDGFLARFFFSSGKVGHSD